MAAGSKRGIWATLVALSMGMLVFGLAESYGPVVSASDLLSQSNSWLGYSVPFVAGGFGALVAGYLAERLGRKASFMLTAAMILVGLTLYLPVALGALPSSSTLGLADLVASMVLVGMAAIGLETPVLAMIAESAAAKERGKYLVITQNFGNLGVALAWVPMAILGLSSARAQTLTYIVALVLMFVGPLVGLVVAWLKVTESLPWTAMKEGRSLLDAWREVDSSSEVVTPTAGLGLRLFVLITLGVVQDVGFIYFVYEAPGLFRGELLGTSLGVLVPMLGGFLMTVVGIVTGLTIAGSVSRKAFTLASFGLMAALWVALWAVGAVSGFAANVAVLALFALLMVPTELTWAARALLEPELFPTRGRGLYVSLVRASVWIASGIITGLLALESVPLPAALAAVTAVMAVGIISSAIWYAKGFETAGKSLAGLDLGLLEAGAGVPIGAGDNYKEAR